MPTYVTRPVIAPMPNLENLRKQAKLYLRWHRDGHHPVAAQIRAVLPRFRDLTKVEFVGAFGSYDEAKKAWKARAQATVDNAHMRYFILHAHKLIDPRGDAA